MLIINNLIQTAFLQSSVPMRISHKEPEPKLLNQCLPMITMGARQIATLQTKAQIPPKCTDIHEECYILENKTKRKTNKQKHQGKKKKTIKHLFMEIWVICDVPDPHYLKNTEALGFLLLLNLGWREIKNIKMQCVKKIYYLTFSLWRSHSKKYFEKKDIYINR